MKSIFVDTSAWDALADQGDPNHSVAMAFRDEIAGQRRLVVTNYGIYAPTMTALACHRSSFDCAHL